MAVRFTLNVDRNQVKDIRFQVFDCGFTIAARSTRPEHLWVAMGFFERPQLAAAIRRHLPPLAAAKQKGMRWKRYLFKQVRDSSGGQLCKSPDCGDCSDYAFCFAPEGE